MKHSVELIELKNGGRGLFIDVPDATVFYADVSFRAGNYLSPEGKMDTAHIMEHLVLGANKRYPKASDYSVVFTQNGAYNNAYTGDYHMGYVAECADFEAERIMDLLCLAIEAPLFLESEFQAERANVREELKSRKNQHDTELSLAVENRMGFVPQSYAQRARQLKDIGLDDIVDHYARTHFTRNMRFVCAGSVQKRREALLARLEQIDMPEGEERIALPDERPTALDSPHVMRNPEIDNVIYHIEATMDHILDTKECDAIGVIEDLLFSTFHSRIFGKAREQGLIYGISQGLYRTRNNHVWTLSGQVQADNMPALFDLVVREYGALKNGRLKDSELDAIKLFQLGQIQRSNQTVSRLANWYGGYFYMTDTYLPFAGVEARVAALTVEDIIAAAQTMLRSKAYGAGLMSRENAVDSTAWQAQLARLFS